MEVLGRDGLLVWNTTEGFLVEVDDNDLCSKEKSEKNTEFYWVQNRANKKEREHNKAY